MTRSSTVRCKIVNLLVFRSQATADTPGGSLVARANLTRPLLSYVSVRMENRGAKGGTPELYFTDPDGILMQIQDTAYCGGSGYLGGVCA